FRVLGVPLALVLSPLFRVLGVVPSVVLALLLGILGAPSPVRLRRALLTPRLQSVARRPFSTKRSTRQLTLAPTAELRVRRFPAGLFVRTVLQAFLDQGAPPANPIRKLSSSGS